jgi:hypothetical protein
MVNHNLRSKREKQKEKKKRIKAKIARLVEEKISKMKNCIKGDDKDIDPKTGKKRVGGTNVFEGKPNATNALGYVGFTNWSINTPPYKIERCDQILLIHGKKLVVDDFCEKREDAFMTMSIYMLNFFTEKDSNKLLESIPMNQITSLPTPVKGAPGCTMWTTKTKSFPFCYESPEILKQVEEAYKKFLNCKNPEENRKGHMLLKACDVKKLDLSEDGPFGSQGPVIEGIIQSLDPDAGKKKIPNLKSINPYYFSRNGELITPGDKTFKEPKDPRFK